MKSSHAIALGIGGATLALALGWWIGRETATPPPALPAPQAVPVPQGPTPNRPSADVAPPGAGFGPAPPAGGPPRQPQGPAAAPGSPQAAMELQQKLSQLMASGKAQDPAAVEALLADAERAHGSPIVGGMDLRVLRENLRRAAEIQRLAKDMELVAKAGKPEDVARLQALMKQIQTLQSGMRWDYQVGTSSGAARP